MALVIKTWKASDQPFDKEGNYILIVGREAGLIAKIRELFGIDPTSTLKVTEEKIYLTTTSLAGIKHHILPLRNVCYTGYEYYKPWREALALFFFLWGVL